MSVAFGYITILKVDYAQIEELPRSGNDVIVPYVLSDTPPEEWKRYFEIQAPASAKAKIVDNTVFYKCPNDKGAMKKGGSCWDTVAGLVEDANRHHLEVELRQRQERIRQAERERQEEQPSQFEIEWDRYMTRD
jgi:hypothetical protein